MKKLSMQNLGFVILSCFTFFISCDDEPDHVEFDCGTVKTAITELSQGTGSYTSSNFNNNYSSNFEEAAIVVYVEDFVITSETQTSCATFTAMPQLIETIRITSTNSITSGGVEFVPDEDLIELFKLHNEEQTYSISEFINAQNEEPVILHMEGDEFVLQLLNQPDSTINQSFEIELIFDDSKTLNIEVPTFEVSN